MLLGNYRVEQNDCREKVKKLSMLQTFVLVIVSFNFFLAN